MQQAGRFFQPPRISALLVPLPADCTFTAVARERPAYRFTWAEKPQLLGSFFKTNASESIGCSEGDEFVNGTTLVVQRMNFGQPWHAHEDFLAAFSPYLAMPHLLKKPVRVLFTDRLSDGKFLPFWSRVFGKVMRTTEMNRTTCFENLVFGAPHFGSFYHILCGPDRYCNNAPNLVLLRRLTLRAFHIPLSPTRVGGKIRVTVHVRGTNAQFKRKLLRVMNNRAELFHRMDKMCRDEGCNATEVDFAAETYSHQLRVAAHSEVMVGTHGASLTLAIYMARGSLLVEFGTGMDFHYVHLCQYTGMQHQMLRGPSHQATSYFADTEGATRAVKKYVRAEKDRPKTPA
eukprot:Hpha_TRINITY_DN16737_c1_g2::TRINITY_DN16737_c1_g2_i2::g.80196::m.80196